MSVELRLLALGAVLIAVFLAGAWYGSRDRLCVTAPTSTGTVVWCANGQPAERIGQ